MSVTISRHGVKKQKGKGIGRGWRLPLKLAKLTQQLGERPKDLMLPGEPLVLAKGSCLAFA